MHKNYVLEAALPFMPLDKDYAKETIRNFIIAPQLTRGRNTSVFYE
jgi:hypothetical protein